ncbi:MAG: dienelactone hydrolase family protein [Betaproteobacteria bacterium]
MPEAGLDRRGFIAGVIAAGFAVTAAPVMAQAITTPMDGLEGGDIEIATTFGTVPGYYAVPKGKGKRPVILVVAEIWGLHEHIKDVCRRLAKQGCFAIANEPYARIGQLWKLTEIKDVLAGANKLTDEQAFLDLDGTVAWAAKHKLADANKLGITGFCRGGRMVWMYSAYSKKVKAGVAWYGPFLPTPPAMPQGALDIADQLKAPVLGLYGGADQGIPQATVERMQAALLAFGKEKESIIHVYPDTPHGFNADYRPSYRKKESEDAWKRAFAWFKKHGVA